MMRVTMLAAMIGGILAYPVLANDSVSDDFTAIYQSHQQQMSARLQALRAQAARGEGLVVQDGKRYLMVNGTRYRLNSDNYVVFDMPKPTFLDETTLRNVFDFFSDDWELTWYDGGVVIVNKLFGNYEYGQGCLLEYQPAQASLEANSRVAMEVASCNWISPPQAPPQALALVAASDSQVTLSWGRTDGADFYRVYRDGLAVANGAAIKALSFTEQGLTPATRYHYQVEACNQHGCTSERSAELSVATADIPALPPVTADMPVVINAGSRTNVINWNPVAGATYYQLVRNGVTLAANLTALSYTDAQLESNTQYQYALIACNEAGCSAPSALATITTAMLDMLDIRVQHKDPQTPAVSLNVRTQNSATSVFSANVSYAADKVYRYNQGIFSSSLSGGQYWVRVNAQPVNGQLCTSDTPNYKRTGGKNAEALIDCLTSVSMVSGVSGSLEFTLADNVEYYVPAPKMYRSADNQEVVTSSFTFTSLNDKVIKVDDSGKLTLVGEGETTLMVQANPDYYRVDQPLQLKVKVNPATKPVLLQKLEIGQATLLPPGAPHQILAPRGQTMVRAYAYARDASNTAMPAFTLTIDANGQQLSKRMICPSTAKVGSFSTPSYQLAEVCYSIIESEEAANFITKGMVLTVSDGNGMSLTAQPKVNGNGTINLKLVPGLNASGVAKVPDIAAFDRTLRQVYPLSKTNISVREPTDLTVDISPALGRVDQLRKLETDGKTYFYGLVPGTCYGTVGLGYVPGNSAVGRDGGCSLYLNSIFVHELGHNFGLGHAPGCGPTSSEPFWISAAWDGVARAALSPAPLFEQVDRMVISPKDKRIRADSDLMNYCFGYRFTQYNYQRVANYVNSKSWFADQPLRSRAVLTGEPVLLISGEILADKVVLEPVIASNNPIGVQEESGEPSPYTLLVNASDGVVMHALPLLQLDHQDAKRFSIELPASAHINALKFFAGEQELALEIRGANEQPKTFSRVSDNGPVISYQGDYVSWDNSKYPWLTLVYTQLDGSRLTLALNATGGELDIDQSKLNGGTLHFSLSDGINSVIHSETLAPR
ncbi:chitinase N-terminal domain-containing protein [Aeromonas cavernicola]|uniref:Fibronectin type-III domain-containing protein n=1 Tax=Aeromonas cavernicola TaxID=1006623 RepID=A0A2H9U8E4_9GAMM|nr:chitinase N-terminal domain-containing protein [Aeromonas cavernicola]PJG60281.1 hypothetical protein CUC53_02475 [Aeromonas cavernicola]